MRRKSLREAFADKFSPEPNTGCWLWCACVDAQGYGKLGPRLAHRASWTLHFGDPGDLHVLHACDNPSCVNPDHLFLGTNLDNIKDCEAKGRAKLKGSPGARNGRARLTPEQVAEIRTHSRTRKAYAAEFGVAPSTISMIWTGRNWPE